MEEENKIENFIDRLRQSENNTDMQRELAKEFAASLGEQIDREVKAHMILVKKFNNSIKNLILELAESYGCMDSSDKTIQAERITDFKNFVIETVNRTISEI